MAVRWNEVFRREGSKTWAKNSSFGRRFRTFEFSFLFITDRWWGGKAFAPRVKGSRYICSTHSSVSPSLLDSLRLTFACVLLLPVVVARFNDLMRFSVVSDHTFSEVIGRTTFGALAVFPIFDRFSFRFPLSHQRNLCFTSLFSWKLSLTPVSISCYNCCIFNEFQEFPGEL